MHVSFSFMLCLGCVACYREIGQYLGTMASRKGNVQPNAIIIILGVVWLGCFFYCYRQLFIESVHSNAVSSLAVHATATTTNSVMK